MKLKRIISFILVLIVLFNGILPVFQKVVWGAIIDSSETNDMKTLVGAFHEYRAPTEEEKAEYGEALFTVLRIRTDALEKNSYSDFGSGKAYYDPYTQEYDTSLVSVPEKSRWIETNNISEGTVLTLVEQEGNQTSEDYFINLGVKTNENPDAYIYPTLIAAEEIDGYTYFYFNYDNPDSQTLDTEDGFTIQLVDAETGNKSAEYLVFKDENIPIPHVEEMINKAEEERKQEQQEGQEAGKQGQDVDPTGLGKNTATPLEMTISEIGLNIGDFILEYLTFLVKEEVTIEKIIFNRVDSLNANFFDRAPNPSTAPATKYVRDAINYWYDFLGKIVIVLYLMALVVVGIMMMLDNPQKKVQAKDLLKKWTIGIAIFYFFPYAIRYGFEINNTLVSLVENQFGGATVELGGYIGTVSDLRYDDIEYRSPEYVTASSFLLKLGSKEATAAYINRLEDYQRKGDTMRIMRSLAGITGRLIFVILWFIMLWQLLIFLYIYYKRYLMIAFLIAIFPITLVQYLIGNIAEGKQSAISSWCKEFFTNLFLQSIHAVIYGIVSGVIINQVVAAVRNGNPYHINWFLMLCAINFVFAGEKILREIMNAGMTASTQAAGDVSKSARGRLGKRKRTNCACF